MLYHPSQSLPLLFSTSPSYNTQLNTIHYTQLFKRSWDTYQYILKNVLFDYQYISENESVYHGVLLNYIYISESTPNEPIDITPSSSLDIKEHSKEQINIDGKQRDSEQNSHDSKESSNGYIVLNWCHTQDVTANEIKEYIKKYNDDPFHCQ
ncbi:hypothetical protein WA158_007425 [Blastocystis sp. Blastoise]